MCVFRFVADDILYNDTNTLLLYRFHILLLLLLCFSMSDLSQDYDNAENADTMIRIINHFLDTVEKNTDDKLAWKVLSYSVHKINEMFSHCTDEVSNTTRQVHSNCSRVGFRDRRPRCDAKRTWKQTLLFSCTMYWR
jgi:hypothetical protein